MITILVTLFAISDTFSQNKGSTESIIAEIRMLERNQVKAILERDIAALNDLFLPDYSVNAPINEVVKKPDVMRRVQEGLIRYSAFESEIESIFVQGDVAITMGRETVKPVGNAPMAGQTVRRRYTHVWLRKDGRWRQLARHANVVCAESRPSAN